MARRLMWPWVVAGGVLVVGTVGLAAAVVGLALVAGGPAMPGEVNAIVRAYGIAPGLAREIVNVARAVETEPYWLADLIHFESAQKFTPDVKNPVSGATGLIQFMPKTAERLDTTTNKLANLTAEQQMAWVQLYLERVAAGQWPDDPKRVPLDSKQRLFMTVFYPPARTDWPLGKRFPPDVIKNNPKYPTPGAYIAAVISLGKLTHLVTSE